MARKGLTVDVETFFLAIALKHGPPLKKYYDYVHPLLGWQNLEMKGISPWVHLSPRGREYMEIVTQFGEAKLRATHWYLKYTKWYMQHKRANYHSAEPLPSERDWLIPTSKWSHDDTERNNARQQIKSAGASRRKSSNAASKR